MHLDDSILRSRCDGELPVDGVAAADAHIAACSDCRSRLEEVETRSRHVQGALAVLAPLPSESPAPAAVALARLRGERLVPASERSLMPGLFPSRLRPMFAGIGLVAVAVVALSFAPVRAFASRFLGLFRVEHIAVVPIDPTRLSELHNDPSLGARLSQLLSDSVKMTRESRGPQPAGSVDEASRLAGFALRLPVESPGTPRITVQDGNAFEFIVDRERAQAILDGAGKTATHLPESVDGARVVVDVPAGVTLEWGLCLENENAQAAAPAGAGRDGTQERPRRFRPHGTDDAACTVLAQIPSPTITAPADIDLARLAAVALELMGMDAKEAASFTRTVDWTSTLVVPIPRNAASVRPVEVDGVTGNLLVRGARDNVAARYTLLWAKGGMVYALLGYGDPAPGIALANSLR